jgi:hypothetical protein
MPIAGSVVELVDGELGSTPLGAMARLLLGLTKPAHATVRVRRIGKPLMQHASSQPYRRNRNSAVSGEESTHAASKS